MPEASTYTEDLGPHLRLPDQSSISGWRRCRFSPELANSHFVGQSSHPIWPLLIFLATGPAVANTRLGGRCGDQLGQDIEGFWYQSVIGPLASLLTGQDSGVDQNFEVVGHGWLR